MTAKTDNVDMKIHEVHVTTYNKPIAHFPHSTGLSYVCVFTTVDTTSTACKIHAPHY